MEDKTLSSLFEGLDMDIFDECESGHVSVSFSARKDEDCGVSCDISYSATTDEGLVNDACHIIGSGHTMEEALHNAMSENMTAISDFFTGASAYTESFKPKEEDKDAIIESLRADNALLEKRCEDLQKKVVEEKEQTETKNFDSFFTDIDKIFDRFF